MDNAQIHMMDHDTHKTNRKARWRPTQEQRTILGIQLLYLNLCKKIFGEMMRILISRQNNKS